MTLFEVYEEKRTNCMKRIPVAIPVLNGNEKAYVNDCLDTVWISSAGNYVKSFEEKFAEYCGVNYALTCSNGTVSLHLALKALDIKEGDEVIIPTFTYIATANTVTYCGAKPIFVDSEEDTWNIDPFKIEEKITERTKAIMPAHLYGHAADMDPILKIAEKYNLFVIEDAAEAHGALYKGKMVGSFGHVGSFSFFGNKIITTGEGGMVTTNDKNLFEKMRILRGQGMDPNRRYWHPVIGYNYRMTNIQAAIGLAQLENIDWHLSERQRVANLYNKYFSKLEEYIELPREMEWGKHVYWMYSILLKKNVKITRDKLIALLDNDGIETRPLFYPMHIMPPYYEGYGKYEIAESISSRGLNVPTHALLTEEDIKYIVSRVEYHIVSEM